MITSYVPYTLLLQEPVLATAPSGDPNSAASLTYLPGSLIRGAIARRLGGAQADLVSLVLSGTVRYLNAYPVSAGRRSLPRPVSMQPLKYPKEDSLPRALIDVAYFDGRPPGEHESESHEVRGHWPHEQLGGSPPAYLTVGDSSPNAAKVAISGRMHQQRDPSRGRAWTDQAGEAHGTIFGYEAIDALQHFAGVLVIQADSEVERDEIAERLSVLMSDALLLGRSRRAGYGGDAILESWGPPQPRELEGDLVLSQDVPAGSAFRVLCTSAYAGRDHLTGQPDPTYLPVELAERLGAGQPVLRRPRWGFTTAGGYNRTWGLPLPQRPVLAPGSVVVVAFKEPIAFQRLLDIEHRGLGDRRVEGFGRVVFLCEPSGSLQYTWPGRPVASRPNAPITGLARTIERAIVMERLGRRSDEVASQIANSVTPLAAIPAASLLSRLRVPVRLGPQQALDELRAWLPPPGIDAPPTGLRSSALRQLERCRIQVDAQPLSLASWLRDMATGALNIENLLRMDGAAQAACIGSEDLLLQHLRSPEVLVMLRAQLVEKTIAALSRRRRAESGREAASKPGQQQPGQQEPGQQEPGQQEPGQQQPGQQQPGHV